MSSSEESLRQNELLAVTGRLKQGHDGALQTGPPCCEPTGIVILWGRGRFLENLFGSGPGGRFGPF